MRLSATSIRLVIGDYSVFLIYELFKILVIMPHYKHKCTISRLIFLILIVIPQLLLKPKYSGIEKIKTIGSTYMAASGLDPGKETQVCIFKS